jgi:hypothetical protein
MDQPDEGDSGLRQQRGRKHDDSEQQNHRAEGKHEILLRSTGPDPLTKRDRAFQNPF